MGKLRWILRLYTEKKKTFQSKSNRPLANKSVRPGLDFLPKWTSLNRSGARTRREFHVTYHMGTPSSPQRTDWQTDTTENISFPLTTYAAGNKCGPLKVVILDQQFIELVNNNILQTFYINDKYFVFEDWGWGFLFIPRDMSLYVCHLRSLLTFCFKFTNSRVRVPKPTR